MKKQTDWLRRNIHSKEIQIWRHDKYQIFAIKNKEGLTYTAQCGHVVLGKYDNAQSARDRCAIHAGATE